jgi:sigma-54 dependent transcriptional regulator, acetoin dehydrogenase operon transcriptional activator AcoR
VHQRRNPAAPFHVLDAADCGDGHDWASRARIELLDGTGVLVIQHVDVLSGRQLRVLGSALQEAWAQGRQSVLRVIVTLRREAAEDDLTKLLRFFPRTVEIPPLRHHIEDLHDLVPFLLARLNNHPRLACSPEAMQILLRSSWPGNTEQLWQVLKRVVQHRRTGTIRAADLPPECWTVSRRLLSPLESMERDAIVQSLLDSGGNKGKAAVSLGMSRATIYRKIHEYGIVTPSG